MSKILRGLANSFSAVCYFHIINLNKSLDIQDTINYLRNIN